MEVVGFVKAMAERTPVEVMLSSDEAEDSGDPDIIMERRKKRRCKEEGEGKHETVGGVHDDVEEAARDEEALAKRRKERRRRRREARRKSAENADVNNDGTGDVINLAEEDRKRSRISDTFSPSQRPSTNSSRENRGNPTDELNADDVLTTTIHSDDEDSDIAEALRLSRLAQETVIIDSDYGEDDDDDVIIEDAFQGVGDGETASMERRNRRSRHRHHRRRLSDNSNEDEDDGENSSSSSSSTQTSAAATSVLKVHIDVTYWRNSKHDA